MMTTGAPFGAPFFVPGASAPTGGAGGRESLHRGVSAAKGMPVITAPKTVITYVGFSPTDPEKLFCGRRDCV
ncbi:hypothetical protein SAMN04488567_1345 [Limimaricola pyoseonensis]|uniref:Uncharacterized protein n=1 Tax=Limimaricola pyoseonensis TaxID=521013 RepID=A0A1G7C3W5_9RHOB|nr:hypothetical protein SAMN04488567_1345 [Limimaricola pyoseonensis]